MIPQFRTTEGPRFATIALALKGFDSIDSRVEGPRGPFTFCSWVRFNSAYATEEPSVYGGRIVCRFVAEDGDPSKDFWVCAEDDGNTHTRWSAFFGYPDNRRDCATLRTIRSPGWTFISVRRTMGGTIALSVMDTNAISYSVYPDYVCGGIPCTLVTGGSWATMNGGDMDVYDRRYYSSALTDTQLTLIRGGT